MCKKETAVSHSSTESEITSLDTGLRLVGLLALELWDLIVSVVPQIIVKSLLRKITDYATDYVFSMWSLRKL